MRKNLKFIIGGLIITGSIIYLGVVGFKQDLSYYKTVEEIVAMGEKAYDVKLRVAGHVAAGSIDRSTKPMQFKITHNAAVIPVTYIGEGVIPNTFKDDCETVVYGVYKKNGVFEADHIQAKCASKYVSQLEQATVKK